MKNQKKEHRKMNKKIWIWVSIVIVIILVILIKYISSSKKPQAKFKTYEITEMAPIKLEGNVSYLDTREIFFDQTLGKISEINVADGTEVAKDTPLLTYVNTDNQDKAGEQQDTVNRNSLQVQQASENLTITTQKYNELLAKLANEKQKLSVANTEDKEVINSNMQQINDAIDQAKSAVEQAKQAVQLASSDAASSNNILEQIRNKINNVIKSPIAGRVTVDPSAVNKSDQAVVKITSQNKNIQGKVTEYDYDNIHVGDQVEVTTVGSAQTQPGKIISISQTPIKDPNNTAAVSYQFKVEGNFPWVEGFSTTISIPQNKMIIPSESVKKDKDKNYVFVYKAGKITKRLIDADNALGHTVVKSGLKWKDKIISNPDNTLQDNQRIQVASDD